MLKIEVIDLVKFVIDKSLLQNKKNENKKNDIINNNCTILYNSALQDLE